MLSIKDINEVSSENQIFPVTILMMSISLLMKFWRP